MDYLQTIVLHVIQHVRTAQALRITSVHPAQTVTIFQVLLANHAIQDVHHVMKEELMVALSVERAWL